MKWRALILASMIIASGFFVGATARAQPYTGTIVFSDLSGNVQDYFEPSDWVVFEVTVLDAGVPLQGQIVNVTIAGDGVIGEVLNAPFTTNSYGQFTGDHTDGGWYTREVGFYTLFVNYSGNVVVTDTFRIYNPVPWSATGWTSNYDDVVTDKFTEDQQVVLDFLALDQYGNPFDGSYGDVWYEITRGIEVVDTGYLSTNNSGGDQEYFYPWNEYQDQFGRYMVTIFNDALPPQAIGTFYFSVVLPDLATINLTYYGDDRTVFREGETVGYEIMLFYDGTIPYDSDSYAARVLLFKNGEEDPLRNNTLNTNSDGEAYNNNLYNIGYSEDVRGTYTVAVYNRTWTLIGSAIFMVIEIEIGILPEKSVYSQGDAVTLTVTTTLEDAYRVLISDASGVTLPTASWNVPAGTSEWWKDFTFAETLPDGWYSVDVYMDTLLLTSREFSLKKITIEAFMSQSYFVPGQSGTLFWRAVNNHDGGAISVTGDSIMHYIDDEWDSINKDLTDISGSSGSFAFTVPRDSMIGTSGDIEIEGEDTASHSDTEYVGFQVRGLDVDVGTDRSSYLPGDTMFITLNSRVGSTNSPVPDVDIKITVQRDGTTIGAPWTVRSNSAGTVSTTFQIPTTATKGIWVMVINATFSGNSDVKYNGTHSFNLMTDPVVALIMYQQKEVYAPGELVTVPYRVLRDGVEVTGAKVTFEAYIMQGSRINIALGFGNAGVITFTLPSNVEGSLYVSAVAITSDGIQASDSLNGIQVSSGQLVLFTTKSIYMPGDNITWMFVLSGDADVSATYRITDPDGYLLAQGVAENGTFSFLLPTEHAVNPTARVYVTGASSTYFASSTAQVYSGYFLEFRVLKNSYAPGDVMKINYTIKKIGDVPDNVNGFQLQITVFGEHVETIWVTEHSGVLEYLIPDNTTDGKHLVMVALTGGTGFDDIQTVIIDSNAGELAHGTIMGMNASGFLALVFAIVALIIAIIGVMKWRSMSKAKAPVQPEPPVQPMQPAETYPQPEHVQETSYQYPQPAEPAEPPTDTGYSGNYPPPPPQE
ncbi:MAG: hypothetical protein KKH41_09450 [Candidatus Thermoplasmatota archaeon]|nr:hypothetical protein [Euryarchaeota archaeon]MBU4032220.1 hypothetical protein [Candidatus Thermoplasmatota archaeon]MBU4072248.1 hypothetical protein [Candidatus Thermoplasmatota archaeon]MBU4143656.1 hypothetical protein [Candidatus Thermoplasmatota archaeon]MBU4592791.1 hypothetical protein [Candidatus Thermoplasmatota archaeon]